MRIGSSGLADSGPAATRLVTWTIPYAAIAVAAVLIAGRTQTPSVGIALGLASGIGLAVWMFFTERLERPLAAFLLYLGLLDGFLKLRTNSSSITLGRDVLLYAIALGFLARAALRRESLRLPPLSGWVLAFTVVVLVQIANPNDTGLVHTLGALRPHLEFVPLFFIGYGILQTRKRLQTFFLLLLLIAAANGVVGVVQLDLTPAQLASWGPGYSYRINGNGTGLAQVSGRTYTTANGVARTRPFGLGDDAGVGALWGVLAVGGALALLSLGPARSGGRISLLLCMGPPLAVVTGEGRTTLIAAVVALFVYVALATTARRLIPTLAATVLALAVIVGVFAYVGSISGSGVFDRYRTVTPSKLASSLGEDKGASLSAIPRLVVHHPLGNGLGSVGPAAQFAGGGNAGSNGETEPGYLISELGIPGLLVYYGFNLTLLGLAATRIRRVDPQARIFVAALVAGLVALLVAGISSTTSATSPSSAYFWFAAGVLSYWLTDRRAIATRFRTAPEVWNERRWTSGRRLVVSDAGAPDPLGA